jgi:hypothetical protein
MPESIPAQPSNQVQPHEVPTSLREAGLTNWIRTVCTTSPSRACCRPTTATGARRFGADYRPPDYIRREHEAARRHRWYMTWPDNSL